MRKMEIDSLFTARVTEYLSRGYVMHTDTMHGSQGEIAKVDLSNGTEIIRVLLNNKFCLNGQQVILKVGRNTDTLRGTTSDTIWNGNLDILEETVFCKVGENYYVTPEEYEAIYAKHWARRERAVRKQLIELGEAAREIVLPFVRRQPKCKRVKASDIERVFKSVDKNRVTYSVTVKGRTYRLH